MKLTSFFSLLEQDVNDLDSSDPDDSAQRKRYLKKLKSMISIHKRRDLDSL
tara:strand:+ start:307 stop:459 length:153 start_codon:yes stop_codon:yes gene_type:complete